MFETGTIFLLIGAFGLGCSTFVGPLFAWALSTFKRRAPLASSPTQTPLAPIQFDVLIAAHNEEFAIAQTLDSVILAASRIPAGVLSIKVTVCLDHCSDNTRSIVESFAAQSLFPVNVIENHAECGKWNVLNSLATQSQAEWIAFVDAASIWSPELLVRGLRFLANSKVMGIAPSYAPQKSGLLERLNWKLEQTLKGIESRSGGPISVHGATVFYRRAKLEAALAELKGTQWLNDDVAIPLTLRIQNPDSQIVYLSEGKETGLVSDVGVRSELGVEYRRRRRMLVGNLQWIAGIFLARPNKGAIIALVSSRRIFRLLWAYWVLFLALGFGTFALGFVFHVLKEYAVGFNMILICALLGLVAVVSGFVISNWLRRLSMAFLSGLQLPRYWKEFVKGRGVLWL